MKTIQSIARPSRGLFFSVSLAVSSLAALASPPEAFIHAGTLYATSPGRAGADVKEDHSVTLGHGVKVDTSYQQTSLNSNSGGGAGSPLTAGDVPPGFYIECHGSDTGGRRWAVLPPYSGGKILTAEIDPKTLEVTQLKFTLGLYADTGRIGGSGGADSVAEVYYKPKN